MRLVLAALVLVSFSAHADRIEDMVGGSSQEREIRWLWKHLGEFVRSCAEAGVECRDPELQSVVRQLLAVLPSQPPLQTATWHQRLKFVSEKQNPGLFQSQTHETHRVAVTEMRAGATVYINSDRIDLPAKSWVGILVHECVHHLGLDDDQRRWPDKVGAAVAAHVEAHWSESDLGEFGHAKSHLRMFSSATRDRPVRVLMQLDPLAIDISATPNAREVICAAGERMVGQTGHSPLWRAARVDGAKGLVLVRGAAKVMSRCQGASVVREVAANFSVRLDLRFNGAFDPRTAWWELPSKIDFTSVAAGINGDTVEQVDLQRTFVIKSLRHASADLGPSDTWRTEMVLLSTDGFEPEACASTYTGAQWFFSRTHTAPWFQYQDSCQITRLKANEWRIQTEHRMPEGLQSDLYTHSMILLQRAGQPNRYAIASRPTYVNLVNPTAPPRARITSWRALDLPVRERLLGQPLIHSYSIAHNQPFWLEFDVTGSLRVREQYFDFDFLVQFNGSTILMPWNPGLAALTPQFVTRHEVVAIPGGQRMRYLIQLPQQLSTVRPIGFKLRRLNIETEDGAWAELEVPNFLEAMFLTAELPQAAE